MAQSNSKQSGCSFTQKMVNQTPIYSSRSEFRKRLKPGRPPKDAQKMHWLTK